MPRRAIKTTQLFLAQPSEIDENGALISVNADGSTRKTKIIGASERLSIDALPVLTQGGIAIAL